MFSFLIVAIEPLKSDTLFACLYFLNMQNLCCYVKQTLVFFFGAACCHVRILILTPTASTPSNMYLLVQAVVHRGPLSTVIMVPLARSATRFFSVVGPTTCMECTYSRSEAPPKQCLFSIPPPSLDCYFPIGLGRERL